MRIAEPGSRWSRVLCALGLALGLWGVLPCAPARAQTAAAPEPVPLAVHQDDYDNLEVHAQGLFHLLREGRQVTATFTSAASAVQHAARQQPQVLFTVPLGFRPTAEVVRGVEGWPVIEGLPDPAVLFPTRFRVRVAPNGAVRYLDGPELDEVGHLAYMLTATWSTTDVLGHYDDVEAHHEGTYALQRQGSLVTVQLRTTRSPVQHHARQVPTVLFTVPAGFRPAHRVQLEVTALDPVDEAGTALPEAAATSSFRVQVDPDGTVRYVDDAGVNEVGYLAYELTTHWFTAAPPLSMDPVPPADAADLCTRHLVVQGAVLAALGRGDKPGPACRTVTWGELQTIETLALRLGLGHAPLQRRDFTGLTGVTDLALRVPDLLFRWWPGDLLAELEGLETLALDHDSMSPSYLLPTLPLLSLPLPEGEMSNPTTRHDNGLALSGQRLEALLAHTPRLTRLTVLGLRTVPDELLADVPALRQLSLKGNVNALPADLLAFTPQLRSLTIEGWDAPTYDQIHDPYVTRRSSPLDTIPAALLRPVPRLERLVLRGNFRELPTTFLAATPRLQHLELRGGLLPASRLPGLLAHTPALRHLTLAGWNLLEPPANLLQGVPQLQSLHLQLAAYFQENHHITQTRLPAGLLDPTPRLQELILWMGGVEKAGIPPDLLAPVPHLRSLRMPHLPSADFLRPVPELKALHLDTANFLSPAVFIHNSRLRSLSLYISGKSVEQLANLLQHLPQLTSLSLHLNPYGSYDRGPGLSALPGLLTHTPHLEDLHLRIDGYSWWTLPTDLLVPVPRLASLDLHIPRLIDLSADLLVPTPQLTSLTLDSRYLETLPADLLVPTPQLTSLTLDLDDLEALPADLLVPTPRLTSLTIRNWGTLTELPPALLAPVSALQDLELRMLALPFSPAAFLVPGTFPPNMEQFRDGWVPRPADMFPHAFTPYPYRGHQLHPRYLSRFWPTPFSAERVAEMRDLLLRYPYLDSR